MHDFLYGFLTWFKAFFDNMLGGVLMVVKGIVLGIIKIFNLPYYFKIWADEAPNFGVCILLPLILFFIYQLVKFVMAFMSVKNSGKKVISAADEELIRQKAVEEYLKKQQEKDTTNEEIKS